MPVSSSDGFPDVPLPYAWAEKIVNRILRNKRQMFAAYAHLRPDNGDDVKLEVLEAVNEAWKNFSLSKVASTFVGTVAGRTMIDICRKARTNRKHEQEYYRRRGESYDPADDRDAPAGEQTLAEWLANICLAFRRTYPHRLWAGSGVRGAGKDKGKVGGYATDQLAGLLALKTRLKLNPYGVYVMLRDFSELRRALRIRRLPPIASIYRLLERAEREVAKCVSSNRNREVDNSYFPACHGQDDNNSEDFSTAA